MDADAPRAILLSPPSCGSPLCVPLIAPLAHVFVARLAAAHAAPLLRAAPALRGLHRRPQTACFGRKQHRNDSGIGDRSCCCRRHCGAVCVQVESALVKPGQTLNADNLVTFWAPRPPASCRGQSADGCRSCSGLVLSEILAVSGACRQLRWALFALVPSRDATPAARRNGGLKV